MSAFGRTFRVFFGEQVFLLLLIIGSLLSLSLIGKMLNFSQRFAGQNLTLFDVGNMLFSLTPFFLFLLLPLACMAAVFLTFLRMNADQELVALKAGGVSLYGMLPATLVLSVLAAALHLWISLYGIEWGMNRFYRIILEVMRTKTEMVVQPGIFNTSIPNLTIYAQKSDPTTKNMENVFIRDESRGVEVTASTGRLVQNPDDLELLLVLNDGSMLLSGEKNVNQVHFQEYIIRFDLKKILRLEDKSATKVAELSWSSLSRMQAAPDLTPERSAGIITEKAKRLLLPLATIILSLLAIPVAVAFSGLRRHYGVLIALGLFFLYYSAMSLGTSLSAAGAAPAWAVLWLPHAALLVLTLWAIRLTADERFHIRLPFLRPGGRR